MYTIPLPRSYLPAYLATRRCPPVGLKHISVNGLGLVSALLAAAAAHTVYMFLLGGSTGYHTASHLKTYSQVCRPATGIVHRTHPTSREKGEPSTSRHIHEPTGHFQAWGQTPRPTSHRPHDPASVSAHTPSCGQWPRGRRSRRPQKHEPPEQDVPSRPLCSLSIT